MTGKRWLWLRWIGVVLVSAALLAAVAVPVFAQAGPYTVKVVQVDTSRFPEIGVWVSVLDAQGNPVTSLPASAFSLSESGAPVTITDVSRSGDQQAGAVSAILVIDRSGSMKSSGKIEAAKAAATAFVDQMRPSDSTGVIAFDTQVYTVQALTSDKNALRNGIAGIQPAGNTALYDALGSAITMLSGAPGRRAIILLSDGLDNSSKTTAREVTNRVNGAEMSVYAIGLGDPAQGTRSIAGIDQTLLRAVAEGSRGSYTYAPDPNGLAALYGQLSRQLQNEYRLTYVSANTLHNGVQRDIAVQIAGAGGAPAAYNPGGIIPETPDTLTWPLFAVLLLGLVFLLALPGLLSRRAGKGILGARRKSRVKLTGASSAGQQQSEARPRVHIQDKSG